MTPEQVQLVAATWADLAPRTDDFSDAFYRHLFAEHPEVRAMFPDDLAGQRAKFAAEVGGLVLAVVDLPAFLARTAELGRSHAGHGVRAGHYRASRVALLGALADLVVEEADGDEQEAVLAAWGAVHDLVAETMLSAGSAAVAPAPAAPTART